MQAIDNVAYNVSTHSHPKVAAEGGEFNYTFSAKFQHTATRRWLLSLFSKFSSELIVSTHSHPKVAANPINNYDYVRVFQHTATRRWLPSFLPILVW